MAACNMQESITSLGLKFILKAPHIIAHLVQTGPKEKVLQSEVGVHLKVLKTVERFIA